MKVYLQKETGKDWSYFREEASRMFSAKLKPEYRSELAGIAKGMNKRGMGEDATDILTLNGFFELLGAFEESNVRLGIAPSSHSRLRHMRCSAFVATGAYCVTARRLRWHALMGQNKGETDADLAKNMSFWARNGHPDGSPYAFGPFLAEHPDFAWQAPYLKDLAENPWALFESKSAP